MFGLTLVMTALLAYQAFMPAVDNGKYMFTIDRENKIIRMNTQDGSMERCDKDFICENDKEE